jgi:hypothetical protein
MNTMKCCIEAGGRFLALKGSHLVDSCSKVCHFHTQDWLDGCLSFDEQLLSRGKHHEADWTFITAQVYFAVIEDVPGDYNRPKAIHKRV